MFDSKNCTITVTVDARKEKMAADLVWELLQEASEIVVAKGKKVLEFSVDKFQREEILAEVLGRSGTLRAPTIKIGNKFLVGFNEDIIKRIISLS